MGLSIPSRFRRAPCQPPSGLAFDDLFLLHFSLLLLLLLLFFRETTSQGRKGKKKSHVRVVVLCKRAREKERGQMENTYFHAGLIRSMKRAPLARSWIKVSVETLERLREMYRETRIEDFEGWGGLEGRLLVGVRICSRIYSGGTTYTLSEFPKNVRKVAVPT